jgi:hypothetical protein
MSCVPPSPEIAAVGEALEPGHEVREAGFDGPALNGDRQDRAALARRVVKRGLDNQEPIYEPTQALDQLVVGRRQEGACGAREAACALEQAHGEGVRGLARASPKQV